MAGRGAGVVVAGWSVRSCGVAAGAAGAWPVAVGRAAAEEATAAATVLPPTPTVDQAPPTAGTAGTAFYRIKS